MAGGAGPGAPVPPPAVAPEVPRSAARGRERLAGVACGFAAAAIWGGGAAVSRHLVTGGLAPLDLALLRYAGCFPIACAIVLALGRWPRLGLGWQWTSAVVLLGGPPYHLLLIAGYGHATAGGGALLTAGLLPVFALMIAAAAGGSAPPVAKALGALLAVAGLALFALGGAALTPIGFVIFAAAALAWAALNHLVRAWAVDPWALTLLLALSSPAFLPAYVLLRPGGVPAPPMAEAALQVAYHGALVAFGATALFFLAIRRLGAPAAALLQALAPGFAAGLGALLLAEALDGAAVAGMILTLAGVAIGIAGGAPRSRVPARRG
jgi:drug/metabolite transporter (DMT)-like permease